METWIEKKIVCSWCGFGKFYPLDDSRLLCTCANCGEFKALEDDSEQVNSNIQ